MTAIINRYYRYYTNEVHLRRPMKNQGFQGFDQGIVMVKVDKQDEQKVQ
ncbi:hypothetical protein [Anabaena sp. AL93]|nr:hypothetical protein [Anabaena sp. AL93]